MYAFDEQQMLNAVDPKMLALFWRMAYERQRIYERRLDGLAQPYSDDPIFQQYRFTNVFRAADRVSQYVIRDVIYNGDYDPAETIFRVLLFRIFNQVETFEHLSNMLGRQPSVTRNWNVDWYDATLTAYAARGGKLWNNAYMITPPLDTYGGAKHTGWLHILDMMVKDRVPQRVVEARSLRDVFELLMTYPTVGKFFAMQWTIDINYSEAITFDEDTFVVPGPGAVRGSAKMLRLGRSVSPEAMIAWLTTNMERHLSLLGLLPEKLMLKGKRRPHLIDVQNCLCEFAKYTRVTNPERSLGYGDKQIKQRFHQDTVALPKPWFPPKWGING